MNTYSLKLLMVAIFLCSCNTDECQLIESYPNGSPRKKYCKIKGEENGFLVKNYHENGVVRSEFNFIREKIEGEGYVFYKSGKVKSRLFYKNDKRHGWTFNYFEDTQEIHIRDYFFQGKIIYSKKQLSNNKGTIELFEPIITFQNDSILKSNNDSIIFNLSFPLPDSLLNGRELTFACELKPASLKDSVNVSPDFERKLIPGQNMRLSLHTIETDSQIFYYHIIDKLNKKIFEPQEKLFIRQKGD